MQAVPLLSAAFFLVMAFLLLYAVAAVQMYTDVFHAACYDEATDKLENFGSDPDMFGCSTPTKEGWWWRECPANYTCLVRAASAQSGGATQALFP